MFRTGVNIITYGNLSGVPLNIFSSVLLTNVDQKSIETEFWIAICRPTGDKWQSKTLFLAIFGPRSSIVKSVIDCRLSGVLLFSFVLLSLSFVASTICMLGSFACFCHLLIFIQKGHFQNTTTLSNGLDPDQARHCARHHLGLDCLQIR